MSTTFRFERHPVRDDRTSAFVALLTETIERMRAAPGALWVDAAEAFDDRPSYVVVSEWRSLDDLAAWEGGEACEDFSVRADPLLREASTYRRFRPER